jgi:nickel transport protein
VKWMQTLSLIVALSCLPARPARSHEFWIARTNDAFTLHSGHSAHSHGNADQMAYNPAFVQSVRCLGRDGAEVKAVTSTGYPVVVQSPCDALLVDFSSGYWTKTPYGLKNQPKNEVKAPLESWRSKEVIKRLDAWSDALSRPLSSSIEIVPLEDPWTLREGKKLHLVLMRDKKPAPSCPVAYDGDTRGMTDDAGRVNIRIRHGGIQIIQASYTEPGDGVTSDRTVHTATLVFQLPD